MIICRLVILYDFLMGFASPPQKNNTSQNESNGGDFGQITLYNLVGIARETFQHIATLTLLNQTR